MTSLPKSGPPPVLIHWKGGSLTCRGRMALRAVATHGSLIVAIVGCLTLADARNERLSDLDTYYANTPYMREMIALYLLGHGTCLLVMGLLCGSAREVTGLLRTGIRLIIAGVVLDAVGFEVAKATAVVTLWTGHNLDFLSTTVAPPVVSVGALFTSVGFMLPRLLPAAVTHGRSLNDYRSLTPLWREAQWVTTAPKPSPSWWRLPQTRLHWLEASTHDALLALVPHFDDRGRQISLKTALGDGNSPTQVRVPAEAAILADAARHAAVPEDHHINEHSTYRLHVTDAPGARGLVEPTQTLGQSRVVTAAREGSVKATHD
jgi:uncharacterized membrane protein YidH (DUF202 family)